MGAKEENTLSYRNKWLIVILIILATVFVLVILNRSGSDPQKVDENKSFPVEKLETKDNSSGERYQIMTYQNADGTFTCQDGSVVQTAEGCLDKAIDTIMQDRVDTEGKNVVKVTVKPNADGTFTCSEGSIVNDPQECADIILRAMQAQQNSS